MAIVGYTRFRMLWGALDWQHGTQNPYSTAQTGDGGVSAAPGAGNIGVRRAVMVFDRSALSPADDDIEIHFDFLNFTGGSPDDTWTTSDYTTLEAYLQNFWTAWKSKCSANIKLREIRWYRHGPGVSPPNPAERVFTLGTMVAGTGSALYPSQMAMSVTFRTALRRNWGRTYLPADGASLGSGLRYGSTVVDAAVSAVDALVTSAASSDFALVVVSNALSAALVVEHVSADDVPDIVRKRRLKHTSYRKILP